MISPTSPISLGITNLTTALYKRSLGSGDVPAIRYREIPDGQSFNPTCLANYPNWRTPGSNFIINEYSFMPAFEVTETGEVFDLNPETLQRGNSLSDSPQQFADSLLT